MPRFTFSNAPSRDQLLEWENERDELVLRLHMLEAKIRAGRAARIPSLNEDVVSNILDHFRLPTTDIDLEHETLPSTLPLRTFCLVSKQWLTLGRVLLYRYFVASDKKIIKLFARTLTNEPAVRPLVRYLHISHWEISDSLHLMPNVHTLWVYGNSTYADQRILLLRRVRHATFRGSEREWCNPPPAWPHLETVEFNVGAVDFTCPTNFTCSNGCQPPFPSLHTMKWTGPKFFDRSMIPVTLPNTLRTIILHPTFMGDNFRLCDLLQNHVGSLERLEIICSRRPEYKHEDPYIEELSSFYNLKVLHYYRNEVDIPDPLNLPVSLVEVFIDWPTCTPAKASTFIRQRSVNGGPLRKFSIWHATGESKDREWQRAPDMAVTLGVKFSVFQQEAPDFE